MVKQGFGRDRARKVAKRKGDKGGGGGEVSKDNSLGRAYIVSLAKKNDWVCKPDDKGCLVFKSAGGVCLHFKKGGGGRWGEVGGGDGLVGWESSGGGAGGGKKKSSTMIWRSIRWSSLGGKTRDTARRGATS